MPDVSLPVDPARPKVMNDPIHDAKGSSHGPAADAGMKDPTRAAGSRVTWEAYGLAVAVTVTTLLIRIAFGQWTAGREVLILFLVPIALSAYLGGLGPGRDHGRFLPDSAGAFVPI